MLYASVTTILPAFPPTPSLAQLTPSSHLTGFQWTLAGKAGTFRGGGDSEPVIDKFFIQSKATGSMFFPGPLNIIVSLAAKPNFSDLPKLSIYTNAQTLVVSI